MLRQAQQCDAVIAATHMRAPNDERLARECGDILDLFAGGHDHHFDVKPIAPHGCYVLKSGTDFKDLTTLTLAFDDDANGKCTVRAENVNVTREAVDCCFNFLLCFLKLRVLAQKTMQRLVKTNALCFFVDGDEQG
jgi:2',3'-cyclic-nucleotide 2'-phosphodiesterase (5'-nucleotidase family)